MPRAMPAGTIAAEEVPPVPEIKRTRLRTKKDLIADSREAADALFRYAERLPDELWLAPADAAGWNVRDHIAHVAWWDRAAVAQMRDGTAQQEALGVSDVTWSRGIDAINEAIRARTIDVSPQDVRALWRASQDDLLALLESFSEKRYQAPAREAGFVDEGEVRLIDVLADLLGGHYREHLAYVRAIAGPEPVEFDVIP